jgi:hypothetical protein
MQKAVADTPEKSIARRCCGNQCEDETWSLMV